MAKTTPTPAPLPAQPESRSVDSYISLALGLAVVLVIGALAYNFSTKKATVSTPDVSNTQNATESGSTTTTNTIVTSEKTHTVKPGETLWNIAMQNYNSGYNWVDIQKANNLKNPNQIETGQVLKIPAATPIMVGQITSGQTTTKAKIANYTVSRGDTLWKIAMSQYGDPYKWTSIAQVNHLTNPNVIHIGNSLKLP